MWNLNNFLVKDSYRDWVIQQLSVWASSKLNYLFWRPFFDFPPIFDRELFIFKLSYFLNQWSLVDVIFMPFFCTVYKRNRLIELVWLDASIYYHE